MNLVFHMERKVGMRTVTREFNDIGEKLQFS